MDFYNTHEIIKYASTGAIDISPADRQEWALFCCALKVLGYDLNTFVAMSNTTPEECKKVWQAEKNPRRYVATEDKAKGKIIALAKASGMDLTPFRAHTADGNQTAVTAVTAVNSGNSGKGGNRIADFDGIELPGEEEKPTPIYISPEEVERAAKDTKKTALYNFLCGLFPTGEVATAFRKYRIGATKEFKTKAPSMATAFPYINREGLCIDFHLMPYDAATGKRSREGYSQNWLMAKRKKSDHRAPWCLFGEHLLDLNPTAPVGVVESEKTALIASIAAPGFVWVATGSLNNLNPRRCQAARSRDLYVFPDADGVEAWRTKAEQLSREGFKVFLCGEYITAHAAAPKDDLADILCRAAKEGKGGEV